MAAILGLEDEEVEKLCRRIVGVWPANYNCPGQIVISGEHAAVEECCAEAQSLGARRAVILKVSGAFHSPLVARAADRLRPALERARFSEPLMKWTWQSTKPGRTRWPWASMSSVLDPRSASISAVVMGPPGSLIGGGSVGATRGTVMPDSISEIASCVTDRRCRSACSLSRACKSSGRFLMTKVLTSRGPGGGPRGNVILNASIMLALCFRCWVPSCAGCRVRPRASSCIRARRMGHVAARAP